VFIFALAPPRAALSPGLRGHLTAAEAPVREADGFLLLSPDGIGTVFAEDLTKEEKALLLAVQPPDRPPLPNQRLPPGEASRTGTSFPVTTT
jgi:hypothetical protein